MSITIVLLILLALLVLWLIMMYNSLVTRRNRVNEAWSDIDVQLKRRYDLIPNLVETVKGYATHERELLEKVTQARAQAVSAHDNPAAGPQEMEKAENQLSAVLRTVFAVAENYPDLKANQNFAQLQGDLTDTEDKIQAARRFYNGTVRDYNTQIQHFPTNAVAGLFAFKIREFFEVETAEEKQNVQVSF